MDVGDHPLSDVVDSELVVAGTQSAALFEPTHDALDDVALAVTGLVETLVARLVLAGGNDILDVVPPQPRPHPWVTVSLVCRQFARPAFPTSMPWASSAEQDDLKRLGFVLLTGGDEDRQQGAPAVADQVDLGAKATLRTPQRMISRFPHLRLPGAAQLRPAVRIFFPPRRRLGWLG
jgi:hypothetical protein